MPWCRKTLTIDISFLDGAGAKIPTGTTDDYLNFSRLNVF